MNINLNGKNIKSQSATLIAFIREQGFETAALVAEVNFKLIRQQEWESFEIKNGDTIELLTFVGGG